MKCSFFLAFLNLLKNEYQIYFQNICQISLFLYTVHYQHLDKVTIISHLTAVSLFPVSTVSSVMAFHCSVNKAKYLITVYKALQGRTLFFFFLLDSISCPYPCWSLYTPATMVVFLFLNTSKPIPFLAPLYLLFLQFKNSSQGLLPHFHVLIQMSPYQRGIP